MALAWAPGNPPALFSASPPLTSSLSSFSVLISFPSVCGQGQGQHLGQDGGILLLVRGRRTGKQGQGCLVPKGKNHMFSLRRGRTLCRIQGRSSSKPVSTEDATRAVNEPLFLTALLTPNTWCLPNAPSALTPAGCPAFWFNSDTIYLDLALDPEVKDYPHFRCQWQVPGCHWYCWLTSYKFRSFPQLPPQVQEFSTITHRTQKCALLLPVYYEEYNTGAAKWKRYMDQGLERRVYRAFQHPEVFSNPEALRTPSFRGFYGGFVPFPGREIIIK